MTNAFGAGLPSGSVTMPVSSPFKFRPQEPHPEKTMAAPHKAIISVTFTRSSNSHRLEKSRFDRLFAGDGPNDSEFNCVLLLYAIGYWP